MTARQGDARAHVHRYQSYPLGPREQSPAVATARLGGVRPSDASRRALHTGLRRASRLANPVSDYET